jgi:hypothetical protein
MTSRHANVRFSQFRPLVDHAGWHVLPAAPHEDVQGPDVRDRIGKDGVVFSAYPTPRASSHFWAVELELLPEWAESTGLRCEIPVDELCERLGFAGDPERSHEFLNARLDDVKAFLGSAQFARTRLQSAIELVKQQSAVDRDMLHELRSEIGWLGMSKALLGSFLFHRGRVSRHRRALRALRDGNGPETS